MTEDPVEPQVEPEPLPAAEPDGAAGPVVLERRYPSTIGGACYIGVLIAAAVGIGIVMGHEWRIGIRVIAAALASAGALRLVLPQRDAGMLAVRHRFVDVFLLVGMAAVLYLLAGSIPDQPGMPPR